jgi:hypothetical protein
MKLYKSWRIRRLFGVVISSVVICGQTVNVFAQSLDSFSKSDGEAEQLWEESLGTRAIRWECESNKALVCNVSGCRDTSPVVSIKLNFKSKTYERCSQGACSTFEMQNSTSGVYTLIDLPGRGVMFKALNNGQHFVDAASSNSTLFINFGACVPAR